MEPKTIRIKASPQAKPIAMERILPAKAAGSVAIFPKAVGHSVAVQGFLPTAPGPGVGALGSASTGRTAQASQGIS